MNLEIEAEIRVCEAQLCTAMLNSDLSALDLLIADDLLFVGLTGELATKTMDLELHRTGNTRFHELIPKELEIRVWSEQFVLVAAKVFLSGTYLGNAFSGDYRYIRIWRKDQNNWQIAGGSVSAMV
jgi:ketosteroid isomerase-like protein